MIARIQVKPGMVEDYLEIANDVDLITKQEEPGMLMHNFDQDPTDPLKFTWSEVYENSEALLVHFGASYAGEYVAKSNELADSFEIEIYGDLSNEAIETVKSFGLPFNTSQQVELDLQETIFLVISEARISLKRISF